MREERLQLMQSSGISFPSLDESTHSFKKRTKPFVSDLLMRADDSGRLLFQPRCGVGGHDAMITLLKDIEAGARPDILSITIDSYTRLKQFPKATEVLKSDPKKLNGYPLVSQGWLRARELEAAVEAPLEVRHGSPDARLLFEMAIAAGITSFEGGGIGYNLPYCKNVPIRESLEAWDYVDRVTGELAKEGVILDRELFGTLSAVLMPPSVSLSLTLLEAILADRAGVKCLSIAYPQGGNHVQDIAALRVIRRLAVQYLSPGVRVFPVLHEFMGAFPRNLVEANALILYGGIVAKLGGATKIITKTNKEAFGIPTAAANAEGINTARVAVNAMLDFICVDEARVEEEMHWIEREVKEIVEPVLSGRNLILDIEGAFAQGQLDMPFSTSRFARSHVMPMRDLGGAIRYLDAGALPLSDITLRRHRKLASGDHARNDVVDQVFRDVGYFSDGHYRKDPFASLGIRTYQNG